MTDRVGQQLGNYRLLRLLGSGAFADVYLGKHLHLNTLAAIKVLQMRLIGNNLERFRSEARAIASLTHPYIVRVLDFGVERGIPFLVMDYAPNGTLRRLYPNHTPLSPATIIPYVTQLSDALQYAHERKMIHRDIKPENMLLGQNHEVLLSDFGLVSTVQSSTSMNTGEMAGTIHYMSPEQIEGKPRPASDQYALGIVVYEWLSGTRPFSGTYWEIAMQHLSFPPPSLREKATGISRDLEEVVFIALEKDVHRRFSSVRAFANALVQASASGISIDSIPTRILPSPTGFLTPPTGFLTSPMLEENGIVVASSVSHNLITDAPVTTLFDQIGSDETALPTPFPLNNSTLSLSKRVLSRRAVLAGLTGLAVVGITGGGIGWWASTQRQLASANKSIPTPSSRALYTFRGHHDAVYDVEWSPNGKDIATASNDHMVKVWEVATGNELMSYNPSAAQNSVGWSHDGKRLAFGGEDKLVQVHDTATGALLLTYTDHVKTVHTVAWSRDDRRIASASTDHTVRIWDPNSGSTSLIYTRHVDRIWSALWSPDGRRIASASDDQTVQVWDAATGELVTTYRGHTEGVLVAAWSPDGLFIASAGFDQTVQVWNAATGIRLLTYHEHTARIWAVNWSPDGKQIVSAGNDKTARVWDATTGRTLMVYRNHSATVFAAQWSPDGQLLASGSADMTVQVWRIP